MKIKFLHTPFLKISLIITLLFSLSAVSEAQVSGKVFRDFNADGTQTTAAPNPIEVGLKDVTVNAYDTGGTQFSAVTDASGNYSISGGTSPYRVEFVLPPFYYATKGSVSNTTVQFVAAGATANLGVNSPEDYVGNTNPYLATPQYVNSTYNNATSGPLMSVATFLYNSTGNETGGLNLNATDNVPNQKATVSQTGALWGEAYQRSSQTMFFSAVLRRFVGFGPLGAGGIYKADMSNPAANSGASNYIDVSTIGIPVGTDGRDASSCNSLATNIGDPAHDLAAADKVGKVGIGGIEYDEARSTLWLINLNDKKLYGIKNVNPTTTPTASDVIGGYTIALPSGYSIVNGELRPWAVKSYRGFIYVGVVADGSLEDYPFPQDNLKGYVLKFDPANTAAGFSVVSSFTFDYKHPFYGSSSGGDKWQPWQDLSWAGTGYSSYNSQPIISDLEFDVDESIIVGVMDRGGMQNGNNNYNSMDCNSTSQGDNPASGDLLRICKTASGYEFSGTGSCTTTIPSAIDIVDPDNNNVIQEYYWGDYGPGIDDSAEPAFSEAALGALAILPGAGQVLSTLMDPENFHSNGLKTFDNTTGAGVNAYNIYFKDAQPYAMAKAIGIGDIELVSETPPLEIGNRVFMDTDSDGEQDANEMGLDGVKVELWKAGAKVTETTTANGGQWYFTNVNTNTDYEVKILTANFPSGKSLTTSNVASNAKDLIDNDASLVGTDAVIAYKTGSAGQNNHSLDFGFKNIASCNSSCLLTTSFLGNTILGFNGSTYNLEGSSNNIGCGIEGTYDMDLGPDGNLYVVSSLTNKIFKYAPSGNCIGEFIPSGNGLSDPRGLKFMPDGTVLVTVYDNGGANGRILRYNSTTGAFINVFTTGTDISPNPIIGPHMGIELGPDGAVWVADYKNDRVLRFDATTGAFLSVFAQFGGFDGTRDIMFGQDGYLYISFRDISTVKRYNYITGAFVDVFANSSQNLYLTSGLTWGPDGLVYIGNVGALGILPAGNIAVIDPITKNLITNIPANTPKRILFQCGTACFVSCTLSLTCSKVDVTTINGTNGSASVSATGGTAPYTYAWSNGATTASITNLAKGTYTVTVSDANNCTGVCSSTVNEPSCNLSASATGANVKCNGGSDGSATVTPSGNIGAVTYLWSNGGTTASISGLTVGTYTVTVTESASCTATASYTVTEPTALSLTCSKVDVSTNSGSDGQASVMATGGTSSYTYLWSNGATASSITGLIAGTYTVTVTDANNCTSSCSSTVNEPGCTAPTLGTNVPAAGTCNGSTPNDDATITFSGVTNATVADRVIGSSYGASPAYGDATNANASTGNLQFTGLKHNTTYTFRFWNGSASCFTDITITTPSKTCTIPCPTNICTPVKVTKL